MDLIWEWQRATAMKPARPMSFAEYKQLLESIAPYAMTLDRTPDEPVMEADPQ